MGDPIRNNMKITVLLLLICFTVNVNSIGNVSFFFRAFQSLLNGQVNLDPDIGLNITQLLKNYNYTVEAHDVVTEDGYILTAHRVPYGRNGAGKEVPNRPVALLGHCLACSSIDWVWQGPNNSLALMLADAGYDVWLVNNRGNVHSMRHQTLSTSDAKFWDFSFHEKGYYDLPAIVDYILDFAQVDNITYVGHSQGTTASLVLTTSRPEYNDKFNLMVLFSPIVYLDHMSSPSVRFLAKYFSLIKAASTVLNVHGIPYTPAINILAETICNEDSSLQGFCIFLIQLFAGFDYNQVDRSKLAVYLSNTPNGISIKDMEHFIQLVYSGEFRQFDFGSDLANLLHYKTAQPPSYDFKNLKAPLGVYYAKNDFLATVTDVERFLAQLSHDTLETYLIDYDFFNHLDFVTAKDAKSLLYDRVVRLIDQSNPSITANRLK
ncbi:lipase 3 isoform X1 [Dendroctonus ponderosae]|uniref:Lipase n=1 Tax=Dendroctonus ponderosae TaxID=77166 RepID=U4UFX3_DENPD|nr:lipase 3 isoform X1 [Dendroctonus ponderosae]ERL92854.1 hypothetical protein D910_10161 [Dendroctonus ponderosae]KAH1026802.1 hypothetical protein HUJ05_000420 [Dendroctonus ponderosae]